MRRLFLLFAAGAVIGGLGYPDNPPPAHTGGFGEPTCLACHFDGDLNPPGGRLRTEGLEEKPDSAGRYVLEVVLENDAMERAGFQLAARFADGRQAGMLEAVDERVVVDTAAGVQYARHALAGTYPEHEGEARWTVAWQAPLEPAGVVFHIAANAANGDASEFGDAIYQLEQHLNDGNP